MLTAPEAACALGPVFDENTGMTARPVYGKYKSYVIPALELPVLVALLNGIGRVAVPVDSGGERSYETDLNTFWDHVEDGDWEIDDNRFDTNQLGHPYMGSAFQGFARSSGLGFWESSIYTFAGSFFWETAGETARPSINDQVVTGIAGNFMGEPLFRMANLVLEGGGSKPGLWRELGAGVLSPPTGLNRLVFGDRLKPVFPSRNPAFFWRFGVGESINSHPGTVTHAMPAVDFAMYYGLPGHEGYGYDRPFDYFSFRFTALGHAKNAIENIMVNGLLAGEKYEYGSNFQGVWGLYGNYDYFAPHLFKVSSTALSLGTTALWRLTSLTALHGSVTGGAGYGAAGIDEGETRTYRYGTTFQAQADLRLDLGELAQLEAGLNEYYVSSIGGTDPKGSELVGRFKAGITVRISGRHALGLRYVSNLRAAESQGSPDSHQSVETFSILYTWLGGSI